MKKISRVVCGLLVLVLLLSACGDGKGQRPDPTTVPTTQPTTKPKGPNPLAVPQGELDPNRPLPVLAPKFVTDTPADGDLLLAKDGKAMATIVYPAGNAKAQSAVSDLSKHLTKMTGASFPVVTDDQVLPAGNLILVGPTKKTFELGVEPHTGYPEAEKFTVKRADNCLVLIGNDDRVYKGTQHAVTYFLEEAGCGWFSDKDPLWQVVPSCPTLAVKDVDQSHEARIAGRRMGWGNFDIWYGRGDSYAEGHRLNGLISGKWCMENKPEWLALYKGSRDYTKSEWWQYCYTNAEFADAVAEKIIAYYNTHPDVTAFSVSSNDGWYDGWCECDTCKAAGNQSDQYIIFANRIAEKVAEKHPDKLISFLAYHATFPVPEKEHKAHPNLQIMFCVETTPIDDLAANRQVHNGYFWINQITYTQSWLDNVTEYIEKIDLQHVAIWGWFCISDEQYGWQYSHWIQGNVASRNLELFEKLGVEHIFFDSGSENRAMRWPLIYTFAKAAYFGSMTGEEILYDACKRLYGNAADEMFLLYRQLADAAQMAIGSDGVNWVPPALDSVYWYNYENIVEAADAVRAKLDTLTPDQRARAEQHLRYWNVTNLLLNQ